MQMLTTIYRVIFSFAFLWLSSPDSLRAVEDDPSSHSGTSIREIQPAQPRPVNPQKTGNTPFSDALDHWGPVGWLRSSGLVNSDKFSGRSLEERQKQVELDLGAQFLRETMGFSVAESQKRARQIMSQDPKDNSEQVAFDTLFYPLMKSQSPEQSRKILEKVKEQLISSKGEGTSGFANRMLAAIEFMNRQRQNPKQGSPKEQAAYVAAHKDFAEKWQAMQGTFTADGSWQSTESYLAFAWGKIPSGNTYHPNGDNLSSIQDPNQRRKIMEQDINRFLAASDPHWPDLQKSVRDLHGRYKDSLSAQQAFQRQFIGADGHLNGEKARNTLVVANRYVPVEVDKNSHEKDVGFEKGLIRLIAPKFELYAKPNPENPSAISEHGVFSPNPIKVNIPFRQSGFFSANDTKNPVRDSVEIINKLFQSGDAVPITQQEYKDSLPKKEDRYWFDPKGAKMAPRDAVSLGIREYDFDPKSKKFTTIVSDVLDDVTDELVEKARPKLEDMAKTAPYVLDPKGDIFVAGSDPLQDALARQKVITDILDAFPKTIKPPAKWLIHSLLDPAKN